MGRGVRHCWAAGSWRNFGTHAANYCPCLRISRSAGAARNPKWRNTGPRKMWWDSKVGTRENRLSSPTSARDVWLCSTDWKWWSHQFHLYCLGSILKKICCRWNVCVWGGTTPVRREVEDGAVYSEPGVRFMDRHGNSGVRVNEKQRSDLATLAWVCGGSYDFSPLLSFQLCFKRHARLTSTFTLLIILLSFSLLPAIAFPFLFTFLIPNSPPSILSGAAARLIGWLWAWRMPSVTRGHQSERNAPCQGREKRGPEGRQTHIQHLPVNPAWVKHTCVASLLVFLHHMTRRAHK